MRTIFIVAAVFILGLAGINCGGARQRQQVAAQQAWAPGEREWMLAQGHRDKVAIEERAKKAAREGKAEVWHKEVYDARAAANFVKEHRSSSLIQRFATVDEIANMVVYVSSREASVTNGAALRAEGGIIQTIA